MAEELVRAEEADGLGEGVDGDVGVFGRRGVDFCGRRRAWCWRWFFLLEWRFGGGGLL